MGSFLASCLFSVATFAPLTRSDADDSQVEAAAPNDTHSEQTAGAPVDTDGEQKDAPSDATAERQASEIIEPQAHYLSANPDASGVTFMWRGQLRGTLSAQIPVVGRWFRPGFSFAIVPLIELHNSDGSDQLLPNESWRGKLGLHAGWLWGDKPTGRRFYLGGVVQHESDHASDRASAPGVTLQLNDVSVRGSLHLPQPRMLVRVELLARALIITCTDVRSSCDDFDGPASFGAEADLMLDAGGAEPVRGKWYFFSSVHAAGIVPNGEVIRELRTSFHVGVWTRGKSGIWQLFALAFFGNDVGIERGNTVEQVGAGVRWHF